MGCSTIWISKCFLFKFYYFLVLLKNENFNEKIISELSNTTPFFILFEKGKFCAKKKKVIY